MERISKVFGIGMSKTGTTTLGDCLEILGFTPRSGFDPQLKKTLENGGEVEKILKAAQPFRTLEDSPWYHLYPELDVRYPGSKFILTTRKNSLVHAKSSWAHGVRRGQRTGEPTVAYLSEKISIYEGHNNAVMEYFRDRPEDLLVICWENGDGWEKICAFLGVEIPNQPIPHANQGRYGARLPSYIVKSRSYNAIVRTVHQVSLSAPVRHFRKMFPARSPITQSSLEK